MARGEVEGGDLGLELTRSRLEARDERHVAPMSEGGIVARSGFVFQCADAFAHTIMAHPLPALSLLETRVLGVLYEKEHTVPDTYPLTLNALVSGCNQKTSRNPVIEASEAEVQAAIDSLKGMSLVIESSGGRVSRYAHNIDRVLQVPSQSVAILAALMLRGAQTPGELRIATERLHRFVDISSVQAFLDELARRPAGALVVELPRQAGSRENRWAHLLSGAPSVESLGTPVAAAGDASLGEVAALKANVGRLESELAELKSTVARICAELGIDKVTDKAVTGDG
jgi:uncharacterized protein YceH (UPF0502 family)